MKFPQISDVATTDVIKIEICSLLSDALDSMYKCNHRSIIVYDKAKYYILRTNDILKFKLNNYEFNTPLSKIKLEEIPTLSKDDSILDTIDFLDSSMEYICAINSDGSLYGILTHTDIISNIDPDTLMENYRIGDLINMNKHIQKASPNSKIGTVLVDMVSNNYDSVVVVDSKKPIGILTTKDIMGILKDGFTPSDSIVSFMSTPIESLSENSSIKEAITFMKEKHFKRIVIVNKNGELSGLILQKELISLSYSKWSILIKKYSQELNEINQLLEKKNQKYEKLATTDSLTGLYNRYRVSELFTQEYRKMLDNDDILSLFIMDIDYFKKINDTYGHNIGDEILQQISNILLRYLDSNHIIGRWGGEEFVAILPSLDINRAYKLIELLKGAIENFDMSNSIKVTASFGLTEVQFGDELIDAVSRADKALYLAKNSGRNCIKVVTN